MRKLGRLLAVVGCAIMFALPCCAKDELIVGHIADIQTLDPVRGSDNVSANIHLNMFDNLVFIDQKGHLQPDLATSWERPEPNVYVFHIRKGVKFHSGDDCTAEDVKFTLERALSPAGVAAHALINNIDKVEVVDAYTVKIILKEPSSPFIYALGESWGGIVSKKAVEAGKDPTVEPIGTGPFKFVEWQKGDRVILERFDDYWGEKPSFKYLVQRAIPETASRTIELESGGVDIIFDVHHTDVRRIDENPKLKLVRFPSFQVQLLGLNCKKPPLDDVRVRRAISHAIDVVGMQRAVYRGLGYAPTGPLPKGFPFSDWESYPPHKQDIEKAKALLAEAGVKDLKLEIWCNEKKERIDAATIIQNMLSEIGISVEIKVMEYGTFTELVLGGTQDLFMYGWGNNLPDPEYSFARTFATRGIGSNNYSFFSNKEFDDAMHRGRVDMTDEERAADYKEVQRILMDQVPAVWWNVEELVVGTRANVEGFEPLPKTMSRLWKIHFSK